MPVDAPKLSEETVARFSEWIQLGAPYDQPLLERRAAAPSWTKKVVADELRDYWAFQPLERVQPPRVKDERWPLTPIDRFVLARLEEKGLTPNKPATRRKLIRRVYFDVIGLPPTPEEIDAFVNNADAEAYEQLLDCLFDSPHYGERWARHWLDVARFAESTGFEHDFDRKHAYHYRDFVIKALNQDMPFDQFIRWQLAGDEFAPNDSLAMMATGFLGAGVFPSQLTEKEFESSRYDSMDDMLATTGAAMLGLSVGCARCHDHKFDPIPQADYYRMLAIFTTTVRSEIDLTLVTGGEPVKVLVTSEGLPHEKHTAEERGLKPFYPTTYFLKRGDVNQKDGAALPGFLQVLVRASDGQKHWQESPPEDWRTSYRRRALANWITDDADGAGQLAARVIVNRLWQHHLGRGIVATPNDFGRQGEPPTHPALLEFLATQLIVSDWHLKPIHKMIMRSAVYRQDAIYDPADAERDPRNVQLWRFQPRRLEAEIVRDSLLAVSGMLDRQMFGPGTLDANSRRRSIYFTVKRSKLMSTMTLFEAPEPLASQARRVSTTIAPQALMLMNSPQVRGYARSFAERVALQDTDGPERAVKRLYEIALGRAPLPTEVAATVAFLQQQSDSYIDRQQDNPRKLALIDFCQAMLSLNEFVYVE